VEAKIQDIELEWKDNRPKEASNRPELASSLIKKSVQTLQ
jgi:hypothetical protein